MTTQQISKGVSPGRTVTDETLRRETLENYRVLVIESTYAPDGSVPMHTHRFPHVLYVIEGGTVETTSADGEVETVEARAGQTFWREPQSHRSRNVGPTPVRIVEVEIKDPFRQMHDGSAHAVEPVELEWVTDPIDPRRSSASLAGDPTRPGPYTVRMRAEAGYTIGLHEHPAEDEHLTVLSGSIHWATGDVDSGTPVHTLPAGGFVTFPAGTPHRIWTTEPAILQMTGVGPRVYHYFDSADEPRHAP